MQPAQTGESGFLPRQRAEPDQATGRRLRLALSEKLARLADVGCFVLDLRSGEANGKEPFADASRAAARSLPAWRVKASNNLKGATDLTPFNHPRRTMRARHERKASRAGYS